MRVKRELRTRFSSQPNSSPLFHISYFGLHGLSNCSPDCSFAFGGLGFVFVLVLGLVVGLVVSLYCKGLIHSGISNLWHISRRMVLSMLFCLAFGGAD